MANAAKEYADKWALDEADDVDDLQGRLRRFGRVKKSTNVVETVITFQAYKIDATDFTRLLLTNFDELADKRMSNSLFGVGSSAT